MIQGKLTIVLLKCQLIFSSLHTLLSYRLFNYFQVHKKFARDGKATIKLPEKRLQLMLSNCPPDKLIMFLKTMTTKLECLQMKGYLSARTKLLSGKNRGFETISPLTMKELETVHTERAKKADLGAGVTPKGKRKRVGDDKENQPPKVLALILC